MRSMVLENYNNIKRNPLKLKQVPKPRPSRNQVLVEINATGICHTDLHIIEKELDPQKLPIIPGHQIVGTVADTGPNATGFKKGDRVGVTWINSTCGTCDFCKSGRENLCENAQFTGYDVNGGFAEYVLSSREFTFPIPASFDDMHATPLFCAGIIGYRALKLSHIKRDQTLALFGFGASGHIIAQIARNQDNKLMVFTRGIEHQKLARKYGAFWAGESSDTPPEKADAAIITAPSGELVINALNILKKGGRVVIEDIYMTQIPKIDYNKYLYHEKWIGSVTNYTKQDALEFLKLANEIPIKTQIQRFKLEEANKALNLLKDGKINGAGVLKIR